MQQISGDHSQTTETYIRRPAFKIRDPTLYLSDKRKLLKFKRMVLKEYEARGIGDMVSRVERLIEIRKERHVAFGMDDAILQRAIDALDAAFFQMLIDCKNAICGRPQHTGQKNRPAHKGPGSDAQKRYSQEIRALDQLKHLVTVNKGAASRRTTWFVKKFGADWLGQPNMERWRMREWANFEDRIYNRSKELKHECNAKWREQQRANKQKNRAWIAKAWKEHKTKALLRRVRGDRPQSLDRDCLIVGKGDETLVVEEAKELGDHVRTFFAQWFREGEDTWFQHWENGVVVWTHLLFCGDAAGWDARKRLVEGFSEESTPEFEH